MNERLKNIHLPSLGLGKAIKEIGRNAYVDWVIISLVFILIAGLSVAFGVKVYYDMINGKLGEKQSDSSVTTKDFNIKDFEIVTKKLEAKAINRERVKSGYIGLRDPSI